MPTSWRSATSGPDFSIFSSELNGSRVEPEYANVSRTISVSRAFWIESATAAESSAGIVATTRALSFMPGADAFELSTLGATGAGSAAATVVFATAESFGALFLAVSIATAVIGACASWPHADCACAAISSSDGAGGAFRDLDFALAFLITTGGLISSARTESMQATKRTCDSESAARRAFRRLSVRTRSAAARTSASLAFLFPRNGRLSSWAHADTARTARRARPKALRATGPSFLSGRLHIGTDLEASLEQRTRAVAECLRGRWIRRRNRQIIRHDDPLKTRHISHELADLIVLPNHRHVVGVGVERGRTGLDRLRHHLRQRHSPDLAAG